MRELGLSVRVVKVGTCTIDPGNVFSPVYTRLKQQLRIGGGSSVTLLRDEDDVLLIDTGFDNEADKSLANDEVNWDALLSHLKLAGVSPDEVTKVFITHFHRDHFGGIERFPEAKWFCTRSALVDFCNPLGDRFIPLDEGDHILANAVVVSTPGHTRGHGSILWSDSSMRIAVSGDAITNLAWLNSGYIWRLNGDFVDSDTTKKSIAKLLRESDIVIPGHGEPFFPTPRLLLLT